MKARVLVVDDDDDLREGLELLLVDEGYEVTCAEDGRAALRILDAGPLPSVIVLDLMMPVMDGRSFLAELRKAPTLAGLPVVLLTAGALDTDVQALPVEARLRKPVDVDRLLGELRRLG